MKRILVFLGLVLAVFVLAVVVGRMSRPGRVVFDVAQMLDEDARVRIAELSGRLAADRGIPIAVVTIESAAREGAPDTSRFASMLLRRPHGYDELRGKDWHRGILVVLSRDDGKLVLKFGGGWSGHDVSGLERGAAEAVIDLCRQERCAEGLVAGVSFLEQEARAFDIPPLSYATKFARIWRLEIDDFLAAAKNPWFAIGYFKWIIIIFVVWEFFFPWRKNQRKLRDGLTLDVFYTVFNSVLFWAILGTAICEVTHLLFTDALSRFFGIENLVAIRLQGWPIWLRYILLLLLLDCCGYWIHRFMHKSDILWEFHKVHHSAQEIDVFNGIRQHFVENLANRTLAYIPVGLVGFSLTDTFAINVFISLFSLFTHANVKIPLGPLKYLLNNPQMHIWHHARELHDRANVNFGDALSMWDFIFGTAFMAKEDPGLQLGIEENDVYPRSFWGQLVIPFRTVFSRRPSQGSGGASKRPAR